MIPKPAVQSLEAVKETSIKLRISSKPSTSKNWTEPASSATLPMSVSVPQHLSSVPVNEYDESQGDELQYVHCDDDNDVEIYTIIESQESNTENSIHSTTHILKENMKNNLSQTSLKRQADAVDLSPL